MVVLAAWFGMLRFNRSFRGDARRVIARNGHGAGPGHNTRPDTERAAKAMPEPKGVGSLQCSWFRGLRQCNSQRTFRDRKELYERELKEKIMQETSRLESLRNHNREIVDKLAQLNDDNNALKLSSDLSDDSRQILKATLEVIARLFGNESVDGEWVDPQKQALCWRIWAGNPKVESGTSSEDGIG
jgi:hypothetical protein